MVCEKCWGEAHGRVMSGEYESVSAAYKAIKWEKDSVGKGCVNPKMIDENDDPMWDGTDAAHPAWLRGNDRGVEAVCEIMSGILEGNKKPPFNYGSPQLSAVALDVYHLNVWHKEDMSKPMCQCLEL